MNGHSSYLEADPFIVNNFCLFCSKTVNFCRQVESAGVSFITVHGRTKQQRCEPVNTEAVRIINDSLGVPVIHNGDITSLESMNDIVEKTGVCGRLLRT